MLTQFSLATLNVNDDKLSRIQDNVANALNPVLATALLNCVFLQNLTVPASGKLVVAHGLGRAAKGYFVVYATAAVAVPYALAADQTAPNGGLVLTFSSGAGALVSLVVF